MRSAACLVLALMLAVAAPPVTAQTLDRIREAGGIRLGYRLDAAPLSYAGPEGVPAGYSVLICEAVAEHLAGQLGIAPLERTFVPVDVQDRFDAVADGRIDLLCGAASITLARREQVSFSLPTFVDGAAVMLPAGAPASFDALAGKRIGVRAGTTTEAALGNTLSAKGMTAEVMTFHDHGAALAALETGAIDAYFGDQSILFGLFFASDMSESLTVSENTLTVEKHALALRRGDEDFRLAVDRAVSELYVSGRMADFFAEAFPGAQPGLGLKALFLLGPDLP